LASNPRINFVAVVEPEERGKQIADRNRALHFNTLTELIQHEKSNGPIFEAVFICTPTYTHANLIKEALNADKHVICEKPIGHDIDEVDSVFNLAKQKNKFMLTGFQRRWDPSFQRLKNAVSSGQIGTLHKVRSTSRDNPVPSPEYIKISGGIIHDCASHDLDLLRWVIGKEPIKVYTVGVTHEKWIKDLDDWDSVDISLTFPDNVLGTVDVTRKAVYGYDQRLEALGDAGIANTNNQLCTSGVIGTVNGFQTDPNMYSFPTRYKDAYANILDHFIDLVTGVTDKMGVTAEDLHNLTIILDACVESGKTGLPVTIDYSKNSSHH